MPDYTVTDHGITITPLGATNRALAVAHRPAEPCATCGMLTKYRRYNRPECRECTDSDGLVNE